MAKQTWEVRISYEGVTTYFVEARTRAEAEELGKQMYLDGEPPDETGTEWVDVVDVEAEPAEA